MKKEIINAKELGDIILPSVAKLADPVKRTLGPGGRIILVERKGQSLDGTPLGPKITKDGVSVAEECSDPDPRNDVIIQAVKSICKKTNVDAGDGTTSSVVLGESILKETLQVLEEDPNLNPQLVKESLENSTKNVLELLKSLAKEVKDYKTVKEVAMISANGDEMVGDVISKALEHVGAEGLVNVDEGYSNDITLDVVEGYQFKRGAEAKDSFFNNGDRTQFEAENARVIIYDGTLNNYTQLIPAFKILAGVDPEDPEQKPTQNIPPLLIVANEFTYDVINFLLVQKQQLGTVVCPVRGPHMTHVRTGYYDDLAFYTGGTRLGNGGRSITAIEPEDFGAANRVVVTKVKTTVYDGMGDEEELFKRVDQLKAQKQQAETPYDAQVISERLAALTNGVAKIGVGGSTEFEIKERYDRVEDALNAARAAMLEGVVPGGGCTLLRIADMLDAEESVGNKILSRALRAPFYQILSNIGIEHFENDKLLEILENPNLVYDARHKKTVDCYSTGIIDPVKVVRASLENAVSISSLLSTAGGAIIYKES